MFSRPKPHSCVSTVETPTALVVPWTTCVGLDANCGKFATGSAFDVGVKRARNGWSSLKEPLNGDCPAIVSALTAAAVVAWFARELAPIQYCRKSFEVCTQFSSWPVGPRPVRDSVFVRHWGLSGKRPSGLYAYSDHEPCRARWPATISLPPSLR